MVGGRPCAPGGRRRSKKARRTGDNVGATPSKQTASNAHRRYRTTPTHSKTAPASEDSLSLKPRRNATYVLVRYYPACRQAQFPQFPVPSLFEL